MQENTVRRKPTPCPCDVGYLNVFTCPCECGEVCACKPCDIPTPKHQF